MSDRFDRHEAGQEHANWNHRGRGWNDCDRGYDPWQRERFCDPGIYVRPPQVIIMPPVVRPAVYYNYPVYDYGYQYNYGPTNYQRDWVSGGQWGYQADRQRYNQGGYVHPGYSYDYGWSQPNTNYRNDSVSGGPGGYQANRERYNSGWGNPGYSYGYDNGWNGANNVFDMALRGFDAYAGYDIARRYTKNR